MENIKNNDEQKRLTTPVAILRKSQLAEMPSHDFFPNVKKTKTSAVLQAEKDFSFHIWTRTTTFYHAHSNYIEIFIVTEGKLVHHFNKQQSVLKTGDAFIVFPNLSISILLAVCRSGRTSAVFTSAKKLPVKNSLYTLTQYNSKRF